MGIGSRFIGFPIRSGMEGRFIGFPIRSGMDGRHLDCRVVRPGEFLVMPTIFDFISNELLLYLETERFD